MHTKVKVCLVGANLGCKTNIVRKHVFDQFDDRWILALGTKVSKKALTFDLPTAGGRVAVDMTLWDIASHQGFREFVRETCFYGAMGIIAVADMTRRQTLDEVGFWIRDVEDVTGPIPVAIIGANRGWKDHLAVTEAEVADVAQHHEAACFFESSTSGEPIEAAFRYIAKEALDASRRSRASRSESGQEAR